MRKIIHSVTFVFEDFYLLSLWIGYFDSVGFHGFYIFEMARLTCVGVIIFSVFGIIYSLSTGTLHCRGVKDEFAKISSQDLVPDLPTIGEFI